MHSKPVNFFDETTRALDRRGAYHYTGFNMIGAKGNKKLNSVEAACLSSYWYYFADGFPVSS
jgi:hypothetical protein